MLENLSNGEAHFLVALVMSIICGALIGIEREARGKPAGISTNIFVIMGSALFTLLSLNLNPSDPTRIAANIVTGIGFLGAGLILKDERGYITGLTTAASVWFSAAIGMSIGFGWYFAAVVATLASIFIPRIPHVKRMHEDTPEHKIKENTKYDKSKSLKTK